MIDPIRDNFLFHSQKQLYDLALESDVVSILAEKGSPPDHYLCCLEHIEHLVRDRNGVVQITDDALLMELCVPADYLKLTDPNLGMRVVGLGSPIFHPNVRGSIVCLGETFQPGTGLHEIVRMAYEVVSYQMVTADERNAFDPEACRFVRDNPDILKNLRRLPLRRRKHDLKARVYSVPTGIKEQ